MSIRPAGHRLVIRPFKLEDVDDVYSSARKMGLEIVRPNQVREDQSVDKGVVLAIGPTCWPDDTPWCAVGDTILFAKFAPKFIEDPETKESLGILNDMDVVAVLKENTNE
jgi:co-chaperonin GroES (HSP10)